MTEEQKTLADINQAIRALPERDLRIALELAAQLREMVSSHPAAGRFAIALVGAELAAEEH